MADLHTQFQIWTSSRVCFVGIGNVDYGDDGLGVRLAEALLTRIAESGNATDISKDSEVVNRVPAHGEIAPIPSEPRIGSEKRSWGSECGDLAPLSAVIRPGEQPEPHSAARANRHLNSSPIAQQDFGSPYVGDGDKSPAEKRCQTTALQNLADYRTALAEHGVEHAPRPTTIFIGDTTPEKHLTQLTDAGYDHVVFLDAVECNSEPGSVVILNAREMETRFPQISTHKLSLGMLARMIESNSPTKVWLLGIQPETLSTGNSLSACVNDSLELMAEMLCPKQEAVCA